MLEKRRPNKWNNNNNNNKMSSDIVSLPNPQTVGSNAIKSTAPVSEMRQYSEPQYFCFKIRSPVHFHHVIH